MCRMFPLFHQLQEFCSQYGITAYAETASEAKRDALKNDQDWEGYDHTSYVDVDESHAVVMTEQDPMNGQLKDTAAAAGGSDQRSKQRGKQHSKKRGHAGPRATAGSSRGSSSTAASRVVRGVGPSGHK